MKKWCFVSLIMVLLPLTCNAEDNLKARAEAAWAAREDVSQALIAVDLYKQLAAKDSDDFESRIISRKPDMTSNTDSILIEEEKIHGRG